MIIGVFQLKNWPKLYIMKKFRFKMLKKIAKISWIWLILSAHSLYAIPIFNIVAVCQAPKTLAFNATGTASFLITNNSSITRTLTMVPIAGVQQVVASPGACTIPFTLAPGQSCLLQLKLIGSQMAPHTIGGPNICKTIGPLNNSPDSFLCSFPAIQDQLNVTIIPAIPAETVTLTVTPTSLTLVAGSGVSGTLTVTNNATTTTALNVKATLPASWTDVTQDASNCVSIAPKGSCQLIFTPGNLPHPQATIPIQGDNTTTTTVTMEVTIANHVYVGNQGAVNSSVTICNFSSVTGLLSGCTQVTDPVFANGVTGVTLNTGNSILYTVNNAGLGVSACPINSSTGLLNPCTFYADPSIVNPPFFMALNPASTQAFITSAAPTVSICNVAPAGAGGGLSACANSGTNINRAYGVVTNSSGTTLFTSDFIGGTVTSCTITPGSPSTLTGCVLSAVLFTSPYGLAINSANTHLYVVDFSANVVHVCNLIGAIITVCTPTGAFANPVAIALNATEDHAYITNNPTNTVTVCDVNSITGLLSNCQATGSNFDFPFGVTVTN